MSEKKTFIQLGTMRLEIRQIQAYQIIKGTEVITARVVNIDPNSEEGKKLLAEFDSKAAGRAIGAGVASCAGGAVVGTVVGFGAWIAVSAMTGGVAALIGGAIAVGSAALGAKSSLDKSNKKKKDLLKKNETKEVDASVLQIVLKGGEVEEVTEGTAAHSSKDFSSGYTNLKKRSRTKNDVLEFQAGKCGFDIYEKCKELDACFGVSVE